MKGYSDAEQDGIIREYFSPRQEGENPRCPICGELLEVESDYRRSGQPPALEVRCPDCGSEFRWAQKRAEEPWKELHLRYFLERFQLDRPLRCPYDDCAVMAMDFGDGVLEFRCPYCNRRGRAAIE